MIKIVPDKEGKLTQWDLNRKVIVTGYEGVAEVHFASPGDDHGAYPVKLIDGEAEIPNILLTMAGTINVYLYPDDRTVFATTLWVMAREKPDDYIYTETEVLSYKTLDEKIGDLAELTTTARENLVAAINEAAQNGGMLLVDLKSNMTADKTYHEMQAAVFSGKTVIVRYATYEVYEYYILTSFNSIDQALYFNAFIGDTQNVLRCATGNYWSKTSERFESKSYKVTALSASSSDEQYPSAKAVYDAIQAAKPDIVTPTAESTDTQAASAKAVYESANELKSDLDIAEKRAIYYVNPNNLFPKPTIPELAASAIVGKPYSTNGTLVENVTDYCNGVSLPSGGNLGFIFDVDDLVSGKYIFSVKRSGATSYNGRCVIHFLNASLGGYEVVSLDALTVQNPIWEYDLDVETKKESYSGLKYIRILFSNSSSNTAIYSEPVMVLSSAKYTTFLIDNLASYKRSKIYGKKLAVDGDSITNGQGYKGGYAKIIGDRYHMTVQNNAVNGGTLAKGTKTSTGDDRHWICNGIANLDSDADYILISGGINDFFNSVPIGTLTVNKYNSPLDDTTLIGAVERICRELIERFATKKIGFILTHSANDWYRKNSSGVASTTENLTNYHDAIISALNKYSIPYCDLYMNSCFSTEITSLKKYTANNDGIHPTEEGYKLFYVDKIVSFLETL